MTLALSNQDWFHGIIYFQFHACVLCSLNPEHQVVTSQDFTLSTYLPTILAPFLLTVMVLGCVWKKIPSWCQPNDSEDVAHWPYPFSLNGDCRCCSPLCWPSTASTLCMNLQWKEKKCRNQRIIGTGTSQVIKKDKFRRSAYVELKNDTDWVKYCMTMKAGGKWQAESGHPRKTWLDSVK